MESPTQYQDPIEQEYFKDVPTKYHEVITKNLKLYKEHYSSNDCKGKIIYHLDAIAQQKKYNINGQSLSKLLSHSNGYTQFARNKCNDFCTGKYSDGTATGSPRLKSIYQDTTNSPLLKTLVQDYKIHLMPKGSMLEDFEELFQLIKNDEELKKRIVTFKILYSFDDEEQIKNNSMSNKTIFPKIVIYAAAGKENAQIVLNKIYTAFKDKEGLNLTPRFNQKITNYIYYAHGNGDEKNMDNYKNLFEQPDMIHYRSDVTGKAENYYLNILPDEKRQLTEAQKIALTELITIKEKSTSWKPLSFIKDNFFPFISAHYKELILIGCLPLIYLFIVRINVLYRG